MSGDKDVVRKLTPAEWEPFVSANSLPESRQETFEITSVEVEGRTLRATCRMAWYRVREDGRWHLRGAVAAQMSSELKKIHAHVLDGFERREYTAMLTSLQMDFHRAIRDPEQIDVVLRLIDEKVSERDGVIVKRFIWEFDFCGGAFVCRSSGHYKRAVKGR